MATVNAIKGFYMNDLIVAERLAEWQRLKALVLDSCNQGSRRLKYGCATV